MSEKNMNEQVAAQSETAAVDQDLELALQELETLEAPGWVTIGGFSAGISASVASAIISATIVT
ncbi:daptide-type RiPP [Streptomyces sp. NPDC060194]|uniref:daptide-type RiPP n=1 Tax=Streptomyces sp. NPDC060194 TaxID=3347069 RepID=UPI00366108BA